MPKADYLPKGWHNVTAGITVRDAAAAIDFYKRAFGAEEVERMTGPSGKIVHAELRIGDSIVMLNDEFEQSPCKSPQTLGGSTAALNIYVPNVDTTFERAIQAGAQVHRPVDNMFWGDRYGSLIDPFGQVWSISTHQEDLTTAEIQKRAHDFFSQRKIA
jgi:PhnB protein